MPIYEYKCQKCGTEFEKLIRRSGQAVSCPQCGSEELSKLPSLFGFASGGNFESSVPSGGSCSSCGTHNCGDCSH